MTTSGAVRGSSSGGVQRFLGIPYAQAPTGELRWRAPVPASCASGEVESTSFGPSCPQLAADGGYVGSEDCLTINVWAPRDAAGAPVLVYLHGGGNVQGASSYAYFDGQDLAAGRDVVVVTLNYRLGALGFLTHAELNAESDDGVSGNYGILDQQLALRWVRDNISAFGGDPSKVMLFGESAGGQDTLMHLVSPGAKGLFSSALVQSGGIYGTTLADSMTQLAPVVDAVGCANQADPIACMRSANAEAIVRVPSAHGPLAKGMRYGPVVDGVVIPANPMQVIEAGKHNRVPFIIGTNAEETSRMVPAVSTEAEYEAAVRAQYGTTLGNAVLTQYPASRFSSPRQALIAVTTDATWTCPARRIARAVAANQTQPVYRYFFTWRVPGPAGAVVGATHGLEIPFVFGTFTAFHAAFTPDADALALKEGMQTYWTRLAAKGDPNASGQVTWPTFPANGDGALELGTTVAPLASVRGADCDFIDQLRP